MATFVAVLGLLLAAQSAHAACGGSGVPDGLPDPGEQCDDGNALNTDGCLNTCVLATCGDGFVRSSVEQCDDGNTNNNDTCIITNPGGAAGENNCRTARCGDRFVCNAAGCDTGPNNTQAGSQPEECDDGNNGTDTCKGNCSLNACGDGVRNCGIDGICGNGDDVEGCDDANIGNNDACPNGPGGTCQPSTCGDGFVNTATEECDDGNTNNTDGCIITNRGGAPQINGTAANPNCAAAECGDGFTLAGVEQCDDHNTNNADACLNTCRSATCGDGFLQTQGTGALEQCDQGISVCRSGANSTNAGTTCTTDAQCTGRCVGGANPNGACRPATEFADCGGGICDMTGVGCDNNGNNDQERDACRSNCRNAFCGDGVVDTPENCDTAGESAACDGNCTFVICGDGRVNAAAGEQCEDGNHNNGDACPDDGANGGTCKPARCGDGLVRTGVEGCDDANQDNTDACTNVCARAACGDGFLQPGNGEQCDDGNGNNGDTCVITSSGGAGGSNNCSVARCGDGFPCTTTTCDSGPNNGDPGNQPEQCDDGNLINTDACTTACATATCGDGAVQAGEQCDDGQGTCVGGATPGGPCGSREDCKGTCPANSVSPNAPCTANTSAQICGFAVGSGKGCGEGAAVVPGVCQGGNVDDVPDACRTSCRRSSCGDGAVDTGEECDDGNLDLSDSCVVTNPGAPPQLVGSQPAPNCAFAECGDAFRQVGVEECDFGSPDNSFLPNGSGQPCLGNCRYNVCGDGDVCQDFFNCFFYGNGAEECDDGAANSDTQADACRTSCRNAFCGDQVMDTGEECDDGNFFNNDDCVISRFGAPPDPTDPYYPNCSIARCGDGVICSATGCPDPEGCDDYKQLHCIGGSNEFGACLTNAQCPGGGTCTANGDGCNDMCEPERCGDGLQQASLGEQCDDHNTLSGDGCDFACRREICGNNIVQVGETCDDGNLLDDDGCSSLCQYEYCGDGTVNNIFEECEPPVSPPAPNQCRPWCLNPVCGDYITDSNTESCDDGSFGSPTCDGDCTPNRCGDGYVNGYTEACDAGANNASAPDACRPTCVNPSCGDAIIDPGHGEQCDGGTNCTPQCCSRGENSYTAGLAGASCHLSKVSETCSINSCSKAKRISRDLDKIRKAINQALGSAMVGKLPRSERQIRGARKKAQGIIARVDTLCPENIACVMDEVGDLVEILTELEGNLAANQP